MGFTGMRVTKEKLEKIIDELEAEMKETGGGSAKDKESLAYYKKCLKDGKYLKEGVKYHAGAPYFDDDYGDEQDAPTSVTAKPKKKKKKKDGACKESHLDKALNILEGKVDLYESILAEGVVEEDKWKGFFNTLVKQSTLVNDKFSSASEFLRGLIQKAKEMFDVEQLKQMLTRPSKAILNSSIAKLIIDLVNGAGATLSPVMVKNAARSF